LTHEIEIQWHIVVCLPIVLRNLRNQLQIFPRYRIR